MRISDWSSDVCSSDLQAGCEHQPGKDEQAAAAAEVVAGHVKQVLRERRRGCLARSRRSHERFPFLDGENAFTPLAAASKAARRGIRRTALGVTGRPAKSLAHLRAGPGGRAPEEIGSAAWREEGWRDGETA